MMMWYKLNCAVVVGIVRSKLSRRGKYQMASSSSNCLNYIPAAVNRSGLL